MCQVSLVGYAVGGAFLSLTYFDLPYYIVLILVVLEVHVKKQLGEIAATKPSQTSVNDKPQTPSGRQKSSCASMFHGVARR